MQPKSKEIIDEWIETVRQTKKYLSLDIPEATYRDLIEQGMAEGETWREAKKIAKHKLHNIMAAYLGEVDFQEAASRLSSLGDDQEAVRSYCRDMLDQHASTKERQPYLEALYQEINRMIGKVDRILDLACAYHPFGMPWMDLPPETEFFAYDLNGPRIELIGQFFQQYYPQHRAILSDVLLSPPQQEADVAYIFKELHRIEQRRRGWMRQLCEALPVNTLLLTLPTESLAYKNDLRDKNYRMIESILTGTSWSMEESQVGNEMIFCVRKNG